MQSDKNLQNFERTSVAAIATDSFELGKLYFDRTAFDKAEPHLLKALQEFSLEKNWPEYLSCLGLLLRSFAERNQFDRVQEFKEKLQDLIIQEAIGPSAKILYTLGVCAGLRGQPEVAIDYFRKSIKIAVQNDEKNELASAVLGLAINLYNKGLLAESESEMKTLRVLFPFIRDERIKAAALIFEAKVMAENADFEKAVETLWKLNELNQTLKSVFFNYMFLYGLGRTYRMAKNFELARFYLNLLLPVLDLNLETLKKFVQQELSLTGEDNKASDLLFDLKNHVVSEKSKGAVDLKNQFILIDLLKIFLSKPGTVFTKETLVDIVWKQKYNPEIHDNKIYVTIKRLRKMIEPDIEKPKYIFRAKNGYFFTKDAKVVIVGGTT